MDPGPFESALAALSRAEVRYLVVGGVACALNGEGLILLKSKSVREQDRIDVVNLREILGRPSD
jgi:hypothetical protein